MIPSCNVSKVDSLSGTGTQEVFYRPGAYNALGQLTAICIAAQRRLGVSGSTRRLVRCRVPLWQQGVTAVSIAALMLASTPTDVHATIPNPVFYYHLSDHLSSSNLLTDRAGNVVQHYEYNAFGTQRYRGEPAQDYNSRRFTGQMLDEDTGLYYYNARYYDPELGRFIQPDTIVPDPADPQALNRYSYCNNNPVNLVDPSGHGAAANQSSERGEKLARWRENSIDPLGGKPYLGTLYQSPGEEGKSTGRRLGERFFKAVYDKATATPPGSRHNPHSAAALWGSELAGSEWGILGEVTTEGGGLAGAAIEEGIKSYGAGKAAAVVGAGWRPLANLLKKLFGKSDEAVGMVGALRHADVAAKSGTSRLNIFGEGEARGFLDVSPNATFANGRPLTSTLGNGSASDIFIRNAPITGENTLAEIVRLSQPGTRITLMQPASGFQGQALINAFGNNASVNFTRTFTSQTVAPGVDMTIMRLTVGGH